MLRRLTLVILLLAAFPCTSGQAQGFRRSLFGFSFGGTPYGYDYAGYPDPYFLYPYSIDPWERGRFRAPDLLDDPYFYNRVPTARPYRRPLELRGAAPIPSLYHQHLPGHLPEHRVERSVAPVISVISEADVELVMSLQEACETLHLRLASLGGGDAWIEHFQLERLIQLVVDQRSAELHELLARMRFVSENQEYHEVTQIEGFAEMERLLGEYLNPQLDSDPTDHQRNSIEILPAPSPILEAPTDADAGFSNPPRRYFLENDRRIQ